MALKYIRATKIYESSHLGRTTRNVGISGLDLEILRGETFGILGLNGSGKTTTIKLGLGLLNPTEGSVGVFGQNPKDSKTLKDVGYLPELPYFYPYLTPEESLLFYGRLSGIPEGELSGKIGRVLEKVGLAAHVSKKVSEFSKGMLQKLGLAQAVLHDPKLIFLDEPVSGLDPLAIREMRTLLSELRKEGKTLFLSSHSISEVEKLCDRVGILVQGELKRIVEHKEWEGQSGRLEEIFVETVTSS